MGSATRLRHPIGGVLVTEIRNASTIILVRDRKSAPRVLMGQRGAGAAFMPNKFVFPGGAVDPDDSGVLLAQPLPQVCAERLEHPDCSAATLAAAAIRELWEETGLLLGTPGQWSGQMPPDWTSFAATGHRPTAAHLHYVFRAITPPGRPRRFDARFFLADAELITNDLDDFSQASDELSHLQWVPLLDAKHFDLPFITEVVLAEIAGMLPTIGPPASVPFFNNTDENSLFQRLGGQSPLK